MLRGLLVVLFVITTAQISLSQNQVGRFELPVRTGFEQYNVLSGGEHGLLIMKGDEYIPGRLRKWGLMFLDTNLEERWTKDLVFEPEFILSSIERYENKLYLLFLDSEQAIGPFLIVSIDLVSGEIIGDVVANQFDFVLTHLIPLEDRIILGGYVNDRPRLLMHITGNQEFSVVQGYFDGISQIIDLQLNLDGQSYNVVTSERSRRGAFIRLQTYSYDSDYLYGAELKLKDLYPVLDGKVLGFVDGNIIVAGSYGSLSSNFVQGIYFALLKPQGQRSIVEYHDFQEFDHFFDFANPARTQKLKEKASVKTAQGRDVKLKLRFSFQNLVEANGQFILTGEMFGERYIRSTYGNSRRTWDPYGTNYASLGWMNSSFFDNWNNQAGLSFSNTEYELLQGAVIALDAQGNVLWDNALVVDQFDQLQLATAVKTYIGENNIHMMYKHKKEFVHKQIPFSSGEFEENWIPIEVQSEEESIRGTETDIGRAEYWYDNAFFIWGSHRVAGEDGKRSVIFINKVVY